VLDHGQQSRLVIISGPSGAGKSTILRRLRNKPGAAFSVSATTRPQRPGERDGVDYYFLDDDEFTARVERGDFLETVSLFGHRYGTLTSEVEQAVRKGAVLILEIDVQGARTVFERYPGATTIFIRAPGVDVLKERLQKRNSEQDMDRAKRLERAQEELESEKHFQHVIVNDDIDTAAREIETIIDSLT